ncbi:MAG: efflux RND transporter permease subunit, partial [Planctomycetes bacterium]|nr:efflux RND transporter permease subunit [Planctomycetota bacterium]
IEEVQAGLPPGVRIVTAYDRTRLIRGAIGTLTEVMWHEMVIAALAILLILGHLRSAFIICVTLPLSVLFSFLLMWLLRKLGIVDVQANIMSLAGITISIGILVDQAIVMTENATHHLKEKFGDRPVKGDTSEIVRKACRTVGRPIFFSVLIMLLSFIPVFMLSGREGKLFHPLAFTKSFALIGVAIISVTVVPALIPFLLKGRLKSEEQNWIVRSFRNIYRPMLTFFLPRRNLIMGMFAALLILAAGMFPLQAVVGFGASERAWRWMFLGTFAVVVSLTIFFTRGFQWQLLSLGILTILGFWAYHFPKIGVAFMPMLDEGTTLDMPVTVPRASITQVIDDLKARNALIRGFPEVESVIGKAGRADTATDPAPLDMVETFINFRPREQWPRRVILYQDAERQTREVLADLEEKGFIRHADHADDRDDLINEAAQKTLERFDEVMREVAVRLYVEFEHEHPEAERPPLWKNRAKSINRQLHERGTEVFTWCAIEELARAAGGKALINTAARGAETNRFVEESTKIRLGQDGDSSALVPFVPTREAMEQAFRGRVVFRQRTGGPKGDLIDDEMGRVLQVPGWSNIFTQPIINRIEMLSTGVRTDIGVKVFGDDLTKIIQVCAEIEKALKPINGARDVVAAPIQGKGYLEVVVDRERASRF